MVLQTIDGFEDGDVAEWSVVDLDAVQDRVYEGSYAGFCGTGGDVNLATIQPFPDGVEADSFVFYFQETSSQNGIGVRFKNSNGNFEAGFASANSQQQIDHDGGITEINSGFGYNVWVKVEFVFDWANNQFTINTSEPNGFQSDSATFDLKQGVDFSEIYISDYNYFGWANTGNVNAWFDLFQVDTGSDTQAPTAPSNLSKNNVQTTQVDLSWDASSDSGGSGLDHYNVYEDTGSGFSKIKEVSAGTTSTTVTTGSAGASYDYYVTAVDGAGNESSPSNTVTVTYEDAKPSEYNKTKKLDIDSVSGTPTVDKAQPVLLVGGDDQTTGNGDIVIDFSNISGPEDIAVFNQNGKLLDYEIESLDTTTETGVLWAYNSWVRDGTTQAQVVYGDNSANTDRQNVTGTWGNSGQNAVMVQHLQDDPLTATDSTANDNDGTVNGAISTTGQFSSAGDFDGVDDDITVPSSSELFFNSNVDNNFTVVTWLNPDSFATGGDTSDYKGIVTAITDFSTDFHYAFSTNNTDSNLAMDINNLSPVVSNFSLSLDTWQQTGFVTDTSNNETDFYLNGNSDTQTVDYSNATGSPDIVMGNFGSGARELDSKIDETRIYSDRKNSSWFQADYDASPKAGQVFFTQQAAEGTTPTINDYDKYKNLKVTDTNDAGSTISKAQPIVLGSGSDTSGTGDVVIDWSSVSGASDIAVFDDDDTLLNYEIESLDTTAETGVIWVYNDWVRDDSVQARIGYGSGPEDRQDVTNTWDNTGQNTLLVQHLQEDPITATDSTANNIDGTVTGTTSVSGEFDGAAQFDGTDDNIEFSDISFTNLTVAFSFSADAFDDGWIIDKEGNGAGWNMKASNNNDGLKFFVGNSGGFSSAKTGSLNTNTTYNAVGVYDDSSPTATLFVDGGQVDSINEGIDRTSNILNFGKQGKNNAGYYDGWLNAVRVYDDLKSDDWVQADYDASPKAGQVFFNQTTENTTPVIQNWDEKNTATVGTLSDSSSFSNLQKVQPVKITWSNSSSGTGSGDCEFTTSNVSSQDDIVVFDGSETDTRAYEIESFDTANNEAWVWVYGNWDSDGAEQVVVGAGGGDGTDYSGPQNASGTNGTGKNPWLKDSNIVFLQHLSGPSLSGFDSSGNDNNGTVDGAVSTTNGQFNGAASFDGSNDSIDFATGIIPNTNDFIYRAWVDFDSDSQGTVIGSNDRSATYNNPHAYFTVDSNNKVFAKITSPDNSSSEVRTDNSFADGYHLVELERDTSKGNGPDGMVIYVDGVEQSTSQENNQGTSDDIEPETFDVSIGQGGQGGLDGNHFNGVIDEASVLTGTKTGFWRLAGFDASPKGGQTFFSWGGAEDTAEAVVTTQTVTETLTVNEVFTKNLIRQITKTVTETLTVNEVFAKKLIRQILLSLDEVLTVSETKDFVQNLFRGFNETLSASEARSLALSISQGEGFSVDVATGKQISKTFDESFTVNDLYVDNAGFIKGTVTVDGTQVQGANVYIVKSGSGEFKGEDITNSSGNYSIGRVVDDNSRYLVAVDFDDGTDSYGLQKSIEVNFN